VPVGKLGLVSYIEILVFFGMVIAIFLRKRG